MNLLNRNAWIAWVMIIFCLALVMAIIYLAKVEMQDQAESSLFHETFKGLGFVTAAMLQKDSTFEHSAVASKVRLG